MYRPGPVFVLKAKDQFPPNVKKQDIDKVLARKRSETGGLDLVIHIKEGARVMLTSNISIADRLINGQMGSVFKVDVNPTNQNPTILYIVAFATYVHCCASKERKTQKLMSA